MNKAIKTIAKQLPGIKALVAKNQSLIEQLEKTIEIKEKKLEEYKKRNKNKIEKKNA